jgi:hypothetical protein
MTPGPQWLHVFLDVRADVEKASGDFWSAALGWQLGDSWPKHPEFRSFEPPEGDAYVHQQIGDHGPRIHFDLEADARRLVQLGATRVGPGRGWIVLRDPTGLVFCTTGNSPDTP